MGRDTILDSLQPSLRDSITLHVYPGLASWAKFSRPCGTKFVNPGWALESASLLNQLLQSNSPPVPRGKLQISPLRCAPFEKHFRGPFLEMFFGAMSTSRNNHCGATLGFFLDR